ncbi:hypothetical protein ABZY45_34620 [Streptomyces sp. NPDC006516]|uniref:hypothetical protein n=1 Tax=Streptomyces sp. NPDC006516 TaxID=3154309 RepID=UPI0033A9F042
MHKARIAAGLGAAAALLLGGSPAHAVTWDSGIHAWQNDYTGKCLSGSGRTVAQETCGLPVSGGARSTDWTYSDIANAEKDSVLVRNKLTGLCLDTNGTDVYLSGCTTADPGQHWGFNDCERVLGSHLTSRMLTGWKTGGVSMANPADVDDDAKSAWHRLGKEGCGG